MNKDMVETTNEVTEKKIYKKFILLCFLVLAVLILIVGTLYKKSHSEVSTVIKSDDQEVSTDKPANIVLDFYESWLKAAESTTTDPYKLELPTAKILSESLRTRLVSSKGRPETEVDPVLCQTTIPEQVRAKPLYQKDDTASVLVTAKDTTQTAQSVFTLKRHNDGWFIDSILCSPGEFELPREFTFEKVGSLLKNVPPPLDPQHWHIVFVENGEMGHTAPLLFDTESSCVAIDGSKSICDPSRFTEATKVHVFGQMTESGAAVVRLEFIQ